MSTAADAIRTIEPPAPSSDPDSEFFWAGLREEKLLLQRCENCEHVRFPATPTCPYCASPRTSVQQVSGRGAVYSWVVVHRAFHAAFADQVPYIVATVDLDEGARIAVRHEGDQAPDFDQRVQVAFVHHDGWTELRVRPQQGEAT